MVKRCQFKRRGREGVLFHGPVFFLHLYGLVEDRNQDEEDRKRRACPRRGARADCLGE